MNEIIQKRIEEAAENAYPYYKYQSQKKEYFVKGAEWMFDNLWISVDKALPEYYRNVLVIFDDLHIINAFYDGEYWWWNDGFPVGINTYGDAIYSSQQECEDKPTHWMPIPKLKGGKQ